MKIKIEKLDDSIKMPVYSSEGAAGMDLCAYVPSSMEWVTIPPHKSKLIHTGFAMAIPDGYFGAIFARSGLALKEGLRPTNCVGVVDSDYRGEVMVALRNDSDLPRYIKDGERVAQMIIIPCESVELTQVKSLEATERGAGGFGSTGVS